MLPIGGVGLDQERSEPSVELAWKRPWPLLRREDLGTSAYASLFDLSWADFGPEYDPALRTRWGGMFGAGIRSRSVTTRVHSPILAGWPSPSHRAIFPAARTPSTRAGPFFPVWTAPSLRREPHTLRGPSPLLYVG